MEEIKTVSEANEEMITEGVTDETATETVREWEEPIEKLRKSLEALEERMSVYDMYENRIANLESFYADKIDVSALDAAEDTEITIGDVFVKE